MTYNPFRKLITEPLEEADLAGLVNDRIAEGYYIEYKREFPENKKVGHSIASFANSYGGWYFLGIETNDENVAVNVVGVDLDHERDPIAKVRDIIKSHVDPIPIFYIQQVNLAQPQRAVIVVYVPFDQDTPFVTRDGRIYRRTHDSSHPIPETDRYAIDRLVEDGQNNKEIFAKFCRDERTFSVHEGENRNIGWLNIFIKPYSYQPISRMEWGIPQLRTLLQCSRQNFEIAHGYEDIEIDGSLPFSSIFPTQKSIVLKQNEPHYLAFQGLTVELFYDGRAKFHIPINFFNPGFYDVDEERFRLQGITAQGPIDLFSEIIRAENREAGIDHLLFFDAGQLSMSVLTLATYYLDWLEYENNLLIGTKIAVRVNGAWRAIPYFDDDDWSAHVREFGFPIGKNDTVVFPETIGEGRNIDVSQKYNLGACLAEIIGLIFGFPPETHHLAIGHLLQKRLDAQQNAQQP